MNVYKIKTRKAPDGNYISTLYLRLLLFIWLPVSYTTHKFPKNAKIREWIKIHKISQKRIIWDIS